MLWLRMSGSIPSYDQTFWKHFEFLSSSTKFIFSKISFSFFRRDICKNLSTSKYWIHHQIFWLEFHVSSKISQENQKMTWFKKIILKTFLIVFRIKHLSIKLHCSYVTIRHYVPILLQAALVRLYFYQRGRLLQWFFFSKDDIAHNQLILLGHSCIFSRDCPSPTVSYVSNARDNPFMHMLNPVFYISNGPMGRTKGFRSHRSQVWTPVQAVFFYNL